MNLKLTRLTKTAILPSYATLGAAGADLHADIERQVVIAPGERATIPTGIAVALPVHLAMLICPRSGLSHKSGVTVHNGPGVIDSDYRGGIGVILHNTTHQQFVVNPGDRIAQAVIVPVIQVSFNEVDSLDETSRGEGGFGSTGVSETVPNRAKLVTSMSLAEFGARGLAQEHRDRRSTFQIHSGGFPKVNPGAAPGSSESCPKDDYDGLAA